MTVLARIDHEVGASSASVELAPHQILSFGGSKLGLSLKTRPPTSAIDLPQRTFAYQDTLLQASLADHDSTYLGARHETGERNGVVEHSQYPY